MKSWGDIKIAILIPCYNEEMAIGQVVRSFREVMGDVPVYVYDNNSTDKTIDVARSAGAIVRTETLQGKGHVVRRMFSDVEADFYILVDGDATYEVEAAPKLLKMAYEQGLDMVNGARVTTQKAAYRRGHVLGNKVLTGLVTLIFGRRLTDMLSGYRVFSRRFVKSFPSLSRGFEIETEFTIHALGLCLSIGEMEIKYVERPQGSMSKLKTYQDGLKILGAIINIVRLEKPFFLFSIIAFFLFVSGIFLGWPIISFYLTHGTVPRLPTAILAVSLIILSFLSFVCGLILDTVAIARKEQKYLTYLSYPTRFLDKN
ncbi:glycosyltransferase [Bombella saccharophila]|uniref:Glycosyltransferase family 2 protein n=1 Tax=Bombella saccharophila TaxID=2967338 RepID=A0ABT3W682_9PROT|nr:glycosyltransferase [Bombella saccharophila]MCX5614575.1 glycosyltransferase family 2 protein [Bombella saccharophila]PHI96791.1 glycosyl transferase family 2 [Parasaccharibacter apium]